MKKFTTLFMTLMIAVSATMFTSCLSAFLESYEAVTTGPINKVTFCDPYTAVDGSKSFNFKLDEVDSNGKVITSNVIFPSMVTFSQTYHQREFKVTDTVVAAKTYKVVITAPNDATPITFMGGDTFTAIGGNDYFVEYQGKGRNSEGTMVHSFKIVKRPN